MAFGKNIKSTVKSAKKDLIEKTAIKNVSNVKESVDKARGVVDSVKNIKNIEKPELPELPKIKLPKLPPIPKFRKKQVEKTE